MARGGRRCARPPRATPKAFASWAKSEGLFRENPPGGGSFVRGRRWLVPYSPLRGCAEPLATAKIPRRRPPANFKTGSERMKANLKEQRNWTETAFEVERDERSGWALWNGAKWRREKRPRKTKRIMNEDRLLPPHPCPLPAGQGEGCVGNTRTFSSNVFKAFPSPRPSPLVHRGEKTMRGLLPCLCRLSCGLLSGHEHKFDDVRGKGFFAQTRRERRAYPTVDL